MPAKKAQASKPSPEAKAAAATRPPLARAQALLMSFRETPLDLLKPLAELYTENDRLEAENGALQKEVAKHEAEAEQPLQLEVFLARDEGPSGPRARLIGQQGITVCPIDADADLNDLTCGQFVYVERATSKVVARAEKIDPVGEIARIEEVADEAFGQAVVSLRDERFAAYLAEAARKDGGPSVGDRVIYDAGRRMVHRVLPERTDGSDLLLPVSELSGFTLEGLGAPNPVVHDVLQVVKRQLLHPEWAEAMGARTRHSWLFWGPTGTGKTCTIKVIVNEVADFVEEISGRREPRVVFCDASEFYSPYFGESEQRVARWFRKLGEVARRDVRARDGRRMSVPCIVVFEEIEGLLRQRGETGGSAHLFDRVLNLILQKTDEATNLLDAPIVFIATTNKKELVDFAARRRFADREAAFGTLDAAGAYDVMKKKVPPSMPVQSVNGEATAEARNALLQAVIHYLYADGEDQVIADVVLRDSSRRPVCMRDLVTGAILESATSEAIDECLDRSTDAGRLLGLDRDAVLAGLGRQFAAVATSLRPANLRDYAPHLFAEADLEIVSVRPRRREDGRAAIHHYAA
jgi:ATP-dependent 26S proteasome regulatory subunit